MLNSKSDNGDLRIVAEGRVLLDRDPAIPGPW
jgi:hypothetical protein